MSNILSSDDFGLKIYNKFPPKYREDDIGQNFALKRYLESLADGGFKYSIDEINGITDLIDPEKVDAKVLPILLKQYGLEVFNGIPENYLRYLLPKVGEAFSKKGSLSVVEFISSSISGIKTSTEIAYDSNDNPIIDVILEMDYNIGDYFPDVEQFKRLLKSFMPFYCDMLLVYSYLFYESTVLTAKDVDHFMNITDTKLEDGYLQGTVILKDSASFSLSETSSLQCDEEYIDSSIITSSDEVIRLKNGDNSIIEFKIPYEESASVQETLETLEDNVTETLQESVGFDQSGEQYSLTNNDRSLLNSSFCTNAINYYDIITIGDTVEVVFN